MSSIIQEFVRKNELLFLLDFLLFFFFNNTTFQIILCCRWFIDLQVINHSHMNIIKFQNHFLFSIYILTLSRFSKECFNFFGQFSRFLYWHNIILRLNLLIIYSCDNLYVINYIQSKLSCLCQFYCIENNFLDIFVCFWQLFLIYQRLMCLNINFIKHFIGK